MNTQNAIDKALSDAADSAPRGAYGLSMSKEDTTWKEYPGHDRERPDECISLDSRHVLRAYAGVETGNDMSINVGPELILKNEHNRMANVANSDQPDSALGLGMHFKLDF